MSTQFYGKAETAANRILDLFKSGDVPKALAPIFIRRNDAIPCRAWSWSNQLLTALAGYDDARGFRQWHQPGARRFFSRDSRRDGTRWMGPIPPAVFSARARLVPSAGWDPLRF